MHIMVGHYYVKTCCDIIDEGNKTPKQIFFPNLLPTQQLHEGPLNKVSPSHHYLSLSPLILMPYKQNLLGLNMNKKKSSSETETIPHMINYPPVANGQNKAIPFYLQPRITKVRYK